MTTDTTPTALQQALQALEHARDYIGTDEPAPAVLADVLAAIEALQQPAAAIWAGPQLSDEQIEQVIRRWSVAPGYQGHAGLVRMALAAAAQAAPAAAPAQKQDESAAFHAWWATGAGNKAGDLRGWLGAAEAAWHARAGHQQQDAARYRWLRDQAVRFGHGDEIEPTAPSPWAVMGTRAEDAAPCEGAELDAAIDAAMNSGAAAPADTAATKPPKPYRGPLRTPAGDPSWIPRSVQPKQGQRVRVLMDAGSGVGNPLHPGHPGGKWEEETEAWNPGGPAGATFACEIAQTGHATHWMPADTAAQRAPLCTNCMGQGWEPSVYDGRRPCGFCKPGAAAAGEQQPSATHP